MFIAIGLMFMGIAVGFLLRGKPLAAMLARCISPTIILLLFALGISVGGNSALMAALPELGGTAIVLTLAGIAGSFVCVLCIRRFFRQPPEPAAFTLLSADAPSGGIASPASSNKDARS
ncbi:MAG: LysO family transporter [Desulfovibrio sp.]|uniref:LysO family transporter n=1 Tax=Desulfovibrio sp. TaxID=885 RepID=UPI0039E3B72C